jgi:uncharacterized FlaG/YvyC family protein
MAENSISGIQKVGVDPAVNVQPVHTPEPASGTQKAAVVKSEPAQQSDQKSQSEQKPQSGPGNYSDVRLKFSVDEKTNQVTCMVIDRTSHKVIRTIPPDELKNLREGDLVQLYT